MVFTVRFPRLIAGGKTKIPWLGCLCVCVLLVFGTVPPHKCFVGGGLSSTKFDTYTLSPPRPDKTDLPRLQKFDFYGENTESLWCQLMSATLPLLHEDLFVERFVTSNSDKVALLVAHRSNLAHFWSIPWTLYMIGPEWRLQVITTQSEAHFFQAVIQHFDLKNAFVDTFEDLYGYEPSISRDFMVRQQYMLARQFWEGVRGEFVLVFQAHGVPVRRWDSVRAQSFMNELFKYGYAGAPWDLSGDTSGGNGGFSFRRRSFLLMHALDVNATSNMMLKSETDLSVLGGENEDAVLSMILAKVPFGVAPKYIEHPFSSETLSHPMPMGVHNYAPRHSSVEMKAITIMALQEFFDTLDVSIIFDHESEPTDQPWMGIWYSFRERFPHIEVPLECTK